MPSYPSRCELRASTVLLFGVFLTTIAATVSPVFGQTAQPAPGGQGGTAAPAGQGGTNTNQQQGPAQAAPAQAAPAGPPFGFTHTEYLDLSQSYETNPLGLHGYYGNVKSGADTFTA